MPTALDYITKIQVKSNWVQNPALLMICCEMLESHLASLGPSLSLKQGSPPSQQGCALRLCQRLAAPQEAQRITGFLFPVLSLLRAGPITAPTWVGEKASPPGEASLASSVIAGKSHCPISQDNKQNLFPECLLNARL